MDHVQHVMMVMSQQEIYALDPLKKDHQIQDAKLGIGEIESALNAPLDG